MDLAIYAKAFAAGVVGAGIGALTLISQGNFGAGPIAAAAAGGFVSGFGSVYAIPNKTVPDTIDEPLVDPPPSEPTDTSIDHRGPGG